MIPNWLHKVMVKFRPYKTSVPFKTACCSGDDLAYPGYLEDAECRAVRSVLGMAAYGFARVRWSVLI